MQHLVSLGHTKIAHIAGSLYTDTGIGRLQGYRKALMENRIPYIPEYVVESQFNFKGGYQAMKILLELKDPPTAVFAASDLDAIGALAAMKDKNINIPGDISLAGFNNSWIIEQLSPPLTTVETDPYTMGFDGANILIKLIEGNAPPVTHIVFEPKLIIRGSTGPVKSKSL